MWERWKNSSTLRNKDKDIQSKQIDYTKNESALVGKEWDVEEVMKKVNSAKQKLKEEKASTEKHIKMEEEQISELEYQNRLLQLKVKEKDKELSLAWLKIKELKRNIRYNTLKPLPSTPGNMTSKKRLVNVKSNAAISKDKVKNVNFGNKRNSTDDNTRMSMNMENINKNTTNESEVRL